MLEIMLPAAAAAVILVGIHAYLGIHILARGVIFVDLALAQIAALGAITGVLFGLELHTAGSYFASLFATFIGAGVFAFSRGRHTIGAVQEAAIGIVYVVSAALAVMVLDQLPGEAEHLKGMLVGNILFVTWPQVLKTAALYAAVGLAHYVFRERFGAISFCLRLQCPVLGFPVLCPVRLRGYKLGGTGRRAAGIHLPHNTGRGGALLCRHPARPPVAGLGPGRGH